jgi:hypothetical protein
MCSKIEGRLEHSAPLALEADGVKLVKGEKWNRGDSLGPSPGFDCQSISQCNAILAELWRRDYEKRWGGQAKTRYRLNPPLKCCRPI